MSDDVIAGAAILTAAAAVMLPCVLRGLGWI